MPVRSGIVSVLWQPQRRTGKFLLDLVGSLARNASSGVRGLTESEAYCTGVVIAARRLGTTGKVQFAIFSQNDELLTLVFCSASECASADNERYIR